MKKNNLFWCLFTIVLLAVPTMMFTACGSDDDDEEGGGRSSTSAGVVDPSSGLRLHSYGNYTYSYDESGRLDEISSRYQRYQFSYSPNKIVEYYGNEEGEMTTVTYNRSGYVSAMSTTYNEQDPDGTMWTATEKASLSYDGSGHLTKISVSSEDEGLLNGQRDPQSGKSNTTYTFTWSNNRLVRVVENGTETEDNGYTSSDVYTYTFEYDGDYANPFRQWTPSLSDNLFGSFVELLSYVGLLGTGPAELPSSMSTESEETENGKTTTHSYSYNYSYSYTDEGAVRATTINRSTYYFSYNYIDDGSTRALGIPYLKAHQEKTNSRGLFTKHKHSKK